MKMKKGITDKDNLQKGFPIQWVQMLRCMQIRQRLTSLLIQLQ
jgi:hypothetical protein